MKKIKQIIKEIFNFYSKDEVEEMLELTRAEYRTIIEALEDSREDIKKTWLEESNEKNQVIINLQEEDSKKETELKQLNRLLKPMLENGTYKTNYRGNKTKKEAHYLLKDIEKGEITTKYRNFLNKKLNITDDNIEKINGDVLVKKIYKAFQKFRNKRYKTDYQVHKKNEYRESISEAIDMINDGKYTDCDFWACLLYGCIYTAFSMNNIFEISLNSRVYCCDVSINGTGHAIVLYRDEEGYLIPLETTMRDTTEYNYLNKVDIFRSYQCNVLGVFDKDNEYKIVRVR